MAGGKKKKKPLSNPARGFATTSIASKAKTEPIESDQPANTPAQKVKDEGINQSTSSDATEPIPNLPPPDANHLSPEEFERNLEESELQLLVEKYAQKAKRDAARQVARLQTDRRLLRSQADILIIRKWFPPELLDEVLELVISDGRAVVLQNSDPSLPGQKTLSEEELLIRLWVLQQTLEGAEFPKEKVSQTVDYILSTSDRIVVSNKDAVWGLEEALEWLARECSKDELPDYDNPQKRAIAGVKTLPENSSGDTSSVSGMSTPKPVEADNRHFEAAETRSDQRLSSRTAITEQSGSDIQTQPASRLLDYDSDIDPDDLLPVYLETKAKLYRLEREDQVSKLTSRSNARKNGNVKSSSGNRSSSDPEVARLQRKLQKIEGDILFDKYPADQQWETRRIQLEKDLAAERNAQLLQSSGNAHNAEENGQEVENGVNEEADRIAAEVLEEDIDDDDDAIADLFASLPVTEVDPASGKSKVVINDNDGKKITIRDFGKSTGVSPKRILEEACRARDSSVKILYSPVSSASFSNRHAVRISWSKSQESLPSDSSIPDVECSSSPKSITITMISISCPDMTQSEAFVATAALFLIFSSSVREEKVFLRLPPIWRELWAEFVAIKKDQSDSLDREAIREFRNKIREKRDREDEDGIILTKAFARRSIMQTPNDTSDESGPEKCIRLAASGEAFQNIWNEKQSSPAYQSMLQYRTQLPMWGFKKQVLEAIEQEQVVIICGETGCGKSTQVPAFILEDQLSKGKYCKIYCTEPRRISAISLARRVSEELGERKNDLGTSRSLIGYAIRLESNTSKETKLVYATTGIVMRMLEGSNDLKEITHIVIDEVHERSIDSDFLLIILRKLMIRRPDLKVILMSATVDAARFSKYLEGAPILQVPGRTFPVTANYLEDAVELTGYTIDNGNEIKYDDLDDEPEMTESLQEKPKAESVKRLKNYTAKTRSTIAQIDEYHIEFDLILQLIAKISTDENYTKFSKAILVFLPGIAEIRQLNDMLLGHPMFSTNWYIYPLHSTIASEDQEAAFLVPPEGTRKIVLATNIAETGITIPDVTCVIDTGKHREMRFDERRQLSRLLETFISRANAKQRRGRAGRVQEGICFHLFTRYRHDELMSDQQTPEFLRLSLQDLAIRVKICKLGGIEETLSQALDPPSAKNIRRAIDALVDVRALTNAEELTPLGVQLARLPLDVFLGKLILLGSIFKCLDAAITIAAILSSKSPFVTPFGARSQADTVRLSYRRGDSDVLTAYQAYLAWKKVCTTSGGEYQFCRKNFLSPQNLSSIEDLKGQLVVSLVDAGFLPLTESERASLNRIRFASRRRQFFELPQRANVNSNNDLITTSVIAWSFYPKLLTKDGKGWRNIANNQSISLHPSSVNKGHLELSWLSYYHIMQSKTFYNAHETTAVTDFAIALLCGDVRSDLYSGVLILDGNRARFAVSDWKTMLVIKTLRSKLREILTRSFKNPGKVLTAQQVKWLDIWQKIFSQEALLQAKGLAPKS